MASGAGEDFLTTTVTRNAILMAFRAILIAFSERLPGRALQGPFLRDTALSALICPHHPPAFDPPAAGEHDLDGFRVDAVFFSQDAR